MSARRKARDEGDEGASGESDGPDRMRLVRDLPLLRVQHSVRAVRVDDFVLVHLERRGSGMGVVGEG